MGVGSRLLVGEPPDSVLADEPPSSVRYFNIPQDAGACVVVVRGLWHRIGSGKPEILTWVRCKSTRLSLRQSLPGRARQAALHALLFHADSDTHKEDDEEEGDHGPIGNGEGPRQQKYRRNNGPNDDDSADHQRPRLLR